jgi:3-hydroxybutyryl-CoA dehydrogenase
MEIKKVCVLGAGIMGSGIAQVVAAAGFEVTMRDIELKKVWQQSNFISIVLWRRKR